jgi:3-oxoacyl-(acyl-carrier-protein) synthase/acyl carrier protein
VKVDEPLEAYGLDSVMVMQMTNEMEKSFGSLSKTLFFEYQSVRSLADYFLTTHAATLRQMFPSRAEVPVMAKTVAPIPRTFIPKESAPSGLPADSTATPDSLDIAIVGLAGRYPGAENIDAFWRNLRDGLDSITEVPPDRWDWREFYSQDRTQPGAHYSKWGGFINGVDKFDPLFFNIAPNDALYIDPQERLFLETTWAALEDAGYKPEDLRGREGPYLQSQVGVYAGVMYSEYQLLAHEQTLAGRPTAAGSIYASIANRVSYFLDLHGPSMTVDTMCSSSLTCIHLACQDLKSRVTDLAIAGGVNVTIHPNKYLLLSAGQFISTEGRCGSFGEGGDGYIPGEGVGVAVLKRLSDALRDGDHIYGVIKGSALNHGGKANGFSVPNPNAQRAVISRALAGAGIDASRVGYLEAHGTGTKLGDPIEIAGLAQAFKTAQEEGSHCWLGSVKSNIGHGESVAGISGLTKVLLQMKHGQIAPSLHSEVLNPHIDFKATPFAVNQTLRDWERQLVDGKMLPRVAGISSFGAGGSNAHLVIEEFIEPEDSTKTDPIEKGPWLIIFSARTPDRLKEMAKQVHRFVLASPSIRVVDLAYTLQVGRLAMEERLGFIVHSEADLLKSLESISRAAEGMEVRRGRVNDAAMEALRTLSSDDDVEISATVDRWIEKGKLQKLLDLWISGLEINWSQLYRGKIPQRISLPTYPFARDRYWLPMAAASAPRLSERPEAESHSANEQTLKEWLVVKEEWISQPFPEIDWTASIRKSDGQRILILSAIESKAQELVHLIRQMETTAELPAGLHLEALTLNDLSANRFANPPDVVLILAPDDSRVSLAGSVDEHISKIFNLSQMLMREAWNKPVRIYHIYRNAEVRPRLDLEALGGFVRSAMLENKNHVWTNIELRDSTTSQEVSQILLREWLGSPDADQFRAVRYENSTREVHRLAELINEIPGEQTFRANATYLITGGLGPIGFLLCQELAKRYQPKLVILSRGFLDEHKKEQCRVLESLGSEIHYYSVDIGDREAVEKAFQKLKSEIGVVHGVIHLARLVEDGLILAKSWESFTRVVRAKVDGTLYLDELTAAEPLEFFMLFSSMAAFGIHGSSDYGYAAAYQNAFAHYRSKLRESGDRSGKTIAFVWGAWNVDKYQSAGREARMSDAGFSSIDIKTAFPWIAGLAISKNGFAGLMRVRDKVKARESLGLNMPTADFGPLLDIQIQTRIAGWEQRKREGEQISVNEIGSVLRSDDIERLNSSTVDRLHGILIDSRDENSNGWAIESQKRVELPGNTLMTVNECLMEILGLSQVNNSKSFQDYGMDSVSGVRFSMLLEKRFALKVLPQWLVEFSTAERLAAHLDSIKQPLLESMKGEAG